MDLLKKPLGSTLLVIYQVLLQESVLLIFDAEEVNDSFLIFFQEEDTTRLVIFSNHYHLGKLYRILDLLAAFA